MHRPASAALQGHHADAAPLYQEAFELSSEVLGPNHADTLKRADILVACLEVLGLQTDAGNVRLRKSGAPAAPQQAP